MKVKKGDRVQLAISLIRGKDSYPEGTIGIVVAPPSLFSSTVALDFDGRVVREVNPDYLVPPTH